MVVLTGIGHAKIKRHLIQKSQLGQRDALRLELRGDIKHQPVRSGPQAGAVVKRPVGAAAIVVEHKAFHQHDLRALHRPLRGEKLHFHTARRPSVHRVEYVCAQAPGFPSELVAFRPDWIIAEMQKVQGLLFRR